MTNLSVMTKLNIPQYWRWILMRKKIVLYVLAAVCCLSTIMKAQAEAVFYRVEDTNPMIVDFSTITVSADTNQVGRYTDASGLDSGGHYKTVCLYNPQGLNGSIYQTSEYLYPTNGSSGNYTLVKLNEYLSAGIAYVYRGSHYFPSASSFIASDVACADSGNHVPSSYSARIQINKPFIGSMEFDNIIARQCQGTAGQICTQYSEAWQNIQIKGNIIVPQNCVVQPGNTFEIDLGQISQKAFVQGGAGNRPAGFTNRPLTVKVACSGGVQVDALVNVRLEGAAATGYPNALASDNPGVGVVVTKSDGTTLVPNDLNSSMPMQLQDGQGSVVIQSYPISLTGSAPSVGMFTTLANLRFDFS